MKKSLILIVISCLILSGCGSNKASSNVNDDNGTTKSSDVCTATNEQIKAAKDKVLDFYGTTSVSNLSTSVEETTLGCSVVVTFSHDGEKFEFVVKADDPSNLMQVAVD